jgi:hypothetical protein
MSRVKKLIFKIRCLNNDKKLSGQERDLFKQALITRYCKFVTI